jgi:carbamoyltransferase
MGKVISIYGIKDCNHYKHPGFVHDHSICVGKNGIVFDYLHLERYTGRKYDNRLDEYFDNFIEEEIIKLDQEDVLLSVNSFVGQSFISKKGIVRIEPVNKVHLSVDLQEATSLFVDEWQQKRLKAYIVPHEIAHIFTNLIFYGEFRDNSLVIHFDGGASVGNVSVFLYKDNKLQLVEYGWKLHHLSNLYNNNALVFSLVGASPGEHCSVPGKFMGLAAIGKPDIKIINWLEKNKFFEDIWIDKSRFYNEFYMKFGVLINEIDNRKQIFQDVAASIQKYFVDKTLEYIYGLKEKYNCQYLYLSGGCGLNIKLNSILVSDKIFEDVFIPPCCNDSGLSLGALAYYFWANGIEVQRHSPYLNSLFCDLKRKYGDIEIELIKKISEILNNGGIIGIANEQGESGPRALGNRSILALANSIQLKEKVSMGIKKREWYRPIAPIMLERNTKYYTGFSNINHLSKYMLLDFFIRKDLIEEINGVVHSDGTSRIQTIFSRNENPFIYDLLVYLEEVKGIKALINTSFNCKGNPMIHTKNEAIKTAKEMGLDAVVVDYELHILNNQIHSLLK